MSNWSEIIETQRQEEYFKNLKKFIDDEYESKTIYPDKENIFKAFAITPIENLKIVILGQDPYHGEGQAMGLSFSTPKSVKNPPSMQNILKEIHNDLNTNSLCEDGDLIPWAKQGVLLLNTILTVRQAQAKSHHNKGWEIFTDNIIKYISNNLDNIIFILWGAPAISKQKIIDTSKHFILTSPHPSPLSAYRGFFGCKHFSKANQILKNIGKEPITW